MRKVRFTYLLNLLFFINFMLGYTYSNAQCTGIEIWRDDFNGSALDLTKWAYETGDGCPSLCGWGNNELEYYTNSTQNIQVTGGNLVITVRSEPKVAGSGRNFSSGKILTRDVPNPPNTNNWTYGRFEAFMRLPKGAGLWPAFWMLPYQSAIPWPTSGEIDIMEHRGDQSNTSSSALHYGPAWPANQNDGNAFVNGAIDYSTGYHLFAVEWSPTSLRFYVDNNLIKVETNYLTPNTLSPTSGANPWPWTIPYFMIINVAVGGWYTGVTTDAGVVLTKPTMEVDYVRILDMTTQVPFNAIIPIPGKIEVENYDLGCDVPTYFDTSPFNEGSVCCGYTYRQHEGVDMEPTGDVGGGYNLGWVSTGEWLTYTINATQTATYDFTFRTATPNNGGALRVEIDGFDVTGSVAIPNSGAWGNWTNVLRTTTSITAGTHTLRLYIINGGFNINYINTAINTILPVELLYFKARKENMGVMLSWEVSTKINHKEFQIEKSTDLMHWISLDTIKEAEGHYAFSYLDLTGSSQESSFYRLKQLDEDGKISYSEIVEVNSIEKKSFSLYPNPFKDYVILKSMEQPSEIFVSDVLGNKVKAFSKDLTKEMTLPLMDLAKGVYFVMVISASKSESFRVVKE